MEKTWFVQFLTSKFEWNLNKEIKCQMIFQLTIADEIPFMKKIIIKSSYPGALKSYNFIWIANIF